MLSIRKSTANDLPAILALYADARRFMAENGNPNQWGTVHPPREQLERDIEQEKLYVIADEYLIRGVFFFSLGEDPTYAKIFDGKWSSNQPYGTIHRIAGDGSGGILREAVAFAKTQIGYIRIDTHADNIVMQNALNKHGFKQCGIIYVEDGSPRIAYDLIK